MGIRINRVYTRSGDQGETGLVGGMRVSKISPRVESYGEVDELNAVLGLVKESLPTAAAELRPILEYIQQELFDLGSELATPPESEYAGMWKASATHVAKLEQLCDRFGEGLPELRSFILPGGSMAAGFFHLARTVCRRAERMVIRLRDTLQHGAASPPGFNEHLVPYLNRLSDLLFVLARWTLVQEGKDAPLWKQEKERTLP